MSLTSNNNQILSIYKSRTIIIELLEQHGYNVDEYSDFNINEIDAMISNSQLDMLFITNPSSNSSNEKQKKVYVKYYLETKQLRPDVLNDVIEDLFTDSTTLSKETDTLVIIIDNEPNDSIIARVEYLFETQGIFVVIYNIKRLQFNVLKHQLVPPIRILSEEETEKIMKEYNIKTKKQFPEISRFDPQAQALLLRPTQVCCIERNSVTSLTYNYYRVCV
jgi:DNA-directed RNA polymerase subunit H (RpoH/RPB5)